jgi:hypothetical protein
MKGVLATFPLFLMAAQVTFAAGLTAPALSPPLVSTRFFDPDLLLTTGGVRFSTAGDVSIQPELGVGYRESEREFSGGIEESIHHVHARAGWRFSLYDTLYLSAAAKVPLLTVETAGRYTGQDLGTRRGYDFTRTFRTTPTWTGEFGLHLSSWTDFTLYYDQSPVTGWLTGGPQQEERIGTRMIFRFK